MHDNYDVKLMRAILLVDAICVITMRYTLMPLFVAHVWAACSIEFESCVMNRDCCEGLHCATGDWAYTTDSTCLSHRSMQLNALDLDEKVDLIQQFYAKLDDVMKSDDQVEALTKKYANKREFAKLVKRLERKYGVNVTFDVNSDAKEEL